MSNLNKYSLQLRILKHVKPFWEIELNKPVITKPEESWHLYSYFSFLTRGALLTLFAVECILKHWIMAFK